MYTSREILPPPANNASDKTRPTGTIVKFRTVTVEQRFVSESPETEKLQHGSGGNWLNYFTALFPIHCTWLNIGETNTFFKKKLVMHRMSTAYRERGLRVDIREN